MKRIIKRQPFVKLKSLFSISETHIVDQIRGYKCDNLKIKLDSISKELIATQNELLETKGEKAKMNTVISIKTRKRKRITDK